LTASTDSRFVPHRLLTDVHSRTLAATDPAGAETDGLDQGGEVDQGRAFGWEGFQLCSMDAQSPFLTPKFIYELSRQGVMQ
jgi:hypothetical protein